MAFPQNKDEIEIIMITRREGLLTKVGHDLRLRVQPNSLQVEGEDFSGDISVNAIELQGALVNGVVEDMSSGDSSKILKTLRKKVFNEKRHPKVHFSGTFGDTVEISLDINGVKNPLILTKSGQTWIGEVDYRKFGIAQVSALFGTLKVSPLVEIKVSLTV